MKKVVITILCVWGGLVAGIPLRISPDEFQHLDDAGWQVRVKATILLVCLVKY